jgi:hypothetical protein
MRTFGSYDWLSRLENKNYFIALGVIRMQPLIRGPSRKNVHKIAPVLEREQHLLESTNDTEITHTS